MVVDGDAGVDARVLRHQVADLQQDVACVPGGRGRGGAEGQNQNHPAATHSNTHKHRPDVDGEAAAAAHWVLVGTLQGDTGFGSSTHFAAEHHRLAERAHHVRQRGEELWGHCVSAATQRQNKKTISVGSTDGQSMKSSDDSHFCHLLMVFNIRLEGRG